MRTLGENTFLRLIGIVISSRVSQTEEIGTRISDSRQDDIAPELQQESYKAFNAELVPMICVSAGVKTTKMHGKNWPRKSAPFVGAQDETIQAVA